jgi:hypothetical protein
MIPGLIMACMSQQGDSGVFAGASAVGLGTRQAAVMDMYRRLTGRNLVEAGEAGSCMAPPPHHSSMLLKVPLKLVSMDDAQSPVHLHQMH